MKKSISCTLAATLLATTAFAATKNAAPAPANFNPGAVTSTTTPQAQMKHYFVRVHLPSLFIGWLSGSADYAFSRSTAVGVLGEYFAYGTNSTSTDPNNFNEGASGYAYGAELQYALSHDLSTDGWLVNPYIEDLHVKVNSGSAKQSRNIFMVGTNLSYQWMWASGINMQMGIGAYYTSAKVLFGIGNSHIHPDLNITLGYAF